MVEGATPRAYEVVIAWVEDRILAGTLKVGDSLPAERGLAARLGVSRAAVREAVRSLQAQGVLRSSVGAGGTGGTRVAALPSGALTRFLRIHVALANFPLPDVLEVRVALERLSARLAATRADAADIARMREAIARMRAATTRAHLNDADTAFHVAIAEGAGNRLATDTTVAIRESVRLPMLHGFAALDQKGFEHIAAGLIAEHEQICDAIAEGRAEVAEHLMETHVRTAWATLGEGADRALGAPAPHTPPVAGPAAPAVTMGA